MIKMNKILHVSGYFCIFALLLDGQTFAQDMSRSIDRVALDKISKEISHENNQKNDLWIQNNSKDEISVEFVNSGQVAALQFDIPAKGIADSQFECPEKFKNTDHIIGCLKVGDSIRVAIMSLTNSIIPDSTVLKVKGVNANNVSLNRVVFSDNNATNITPKRFMK